MLRSPRYLLTLLLLGAAPIISCTNPATKRDPPNAPVPHFTPSVLPVGKTPNSIETADFNNDGNPDIAIANTEIAELTILLGNGKGGFTQTPNSPYKVYAKPHTHGIAVADFNSDGRLDMATDDWGENKISIVFGDTNLSFDHQTFYPVGKRPYQRLRTADVNLDGKPDLVTTNLEGNNSTVLLGDGAGHFDPLQGSPFATGKSPSRIAIGDLNGDGVNDIAVSNYNDKTVTIFLMNKTGVAGTMTIQAGNHPDGICIRDLNNDGKNDIAVTNQTDGTLMILLNK